MLKCTTIYPGYNIGVGWWSVLDDVGTLVTMVSELFTQSRLIRLS